VSIRENVGFDSYMLARDSFDRVAPTVDLRLYASNYNPMAAISGPLFESLRRSRPGKHTITHIQ
jgi:hypothetical protein